MNQNVYRVVAIGDTTVGKTSIVGQLVNQSFNSKEQTTVGAMFVLYSEMVDEILVEMQIWDTAGQEKFRSLGPIYYREAAAAIIVFDRTSFPTFENMQSWIEKFTEIAGSEAIIVIVGNKTDLVDDIVVSEEQAQTWANEHGYAYFSTSAKDSESVKSVFHHIAKAILDNNGKKFAVVQSGPSSLDIHETEKKCAC
ncbi:Ras-related protein RABF2b [Tritrichomonas foetus]|uniref:Ras-related protein RABF2b n=1 Tax=Tritrichomonas foetus TaxID=1144522 RepID=A0A1J4KH69_9EUKA|nr:Ras-related protein RABF2b [Tritrichomonas foetus]|eukprot:OHT08998.1 Ras-related protein RABF2b [Tritrichomonas foetus]